MLVIAGPTGSGKTALAIELAKRLGGEIVSADSRQLYRRLDAATAKPTPAERAAVRHWLVDAAEPSESWDAARWAREAKAAVLDIRRRGKVPIVCGGTGLYLRALLEGLSPLPPRDEALRARLSREAEEKGRAALHARLASLDPEAAASIPPGNLQRVVRALEVALLTGAPLSASRGRREGGLGGAVCVVLEVPADELKRRLEARARAFWPALLAEIRTLVPAEYTGDEPAFTSLGYREALAFARGESSEAGAFASLLKSTFAYAKRQRTWFRTQLKAVHVSSADSELVADVRRIWEEKREKAAAAP